MLNLFRNSQAGRARTYLVTRSTIRYGAGGTEQQRPAHQLPEVTRTQYLRYSKRNHHPRYTTDPAKALQFGPLHAMFMLWLVRDRKQSQYRWGIAGYADALFVHGIHNGPNAAKGKNTNP